MAKCTSLLLLSVLIVSPVSASSSKSIPSIVIFGDSLSDTGNTAHLLKSLNKKANPGYLTKPLRKYITNKIYTEGKKIYIPKFMLKAGVKVVNGVFDKIISPLFATIAGKIANTEVIPNEPYWQRRFSNGPVWSEIFAVAVGLDIYSKKQFDSRAFGGAWSVTFDNQFSLWSFIKSPKKELTNLIQGKMIPPSLGLVVQAYLMEKKKLNKDSVYFIFSGGNDYLNMLNFEKNYNSSDRKDYIKHVVEGIENAIKSLIDNGARKIVVIGVPDIGMTPRYIHTSDSHLLSETSKKHNKKLAKKMEKLAEKKKKVRIDFIDLMVLVDSLKEKARDYGITNVTNACYTSSALTNNGFAANVTSTVFSNNNVLNYVATLAAMQKKYPESMDVCANEDSYLFWDDVHPTSRAHLLLALKFCHVLDESGYKVNCPF